MLCSIGLSNFKYFFVMCRWSTAFNKPRWFFNAPKHVRFERSKIVSTTRGAVASSFVCELLLPTEGACRGPNASNPARGRTLPGQERPSNGRPDASQRRLGSMLCPVGLPGALSVDILALLLYWPTYAPITVRLTCTNHSAPYAPFWHILIFYFC